MPTSNLTCWPALVHLCWEVRPRRVLDVGPGHGKAGVLLREYIGTEAAGTGPIVAVDAVEAEPRYLDRFPWLTSIYDTVYGSDVCDLPDEVLAAYDLVVMADVIEHLDRHDALRLLDRIPGVVVIATPTSWFQNPEHAAWPTEEHRSHWTFADFAGRADAHDLDAAKVGVLLVRLSGGDDDG